MKRYKIIVSPSAKGQIKAITAHIRDRLFAPQAAIDTTLAIKDAIASLRAMPERIPKVWDSPRKGILLRRMVVRNYLVYFWIDETTNCVNVVAVIYGKRDQTAQLDETVAR